MTKKIFLTGATGYAGGHLLSYLLQKHPDFDVVALVRNKDQASIIHNTFPSVKTVLGDLDCEDILSLEAGRADVVLNLASADHIPGAISIIKGISKGGKDTKLIHISGSGIINDMANGPGNPSSKVYNDSSAEDVKSIFSLDQSHIHRDVEEAVISAANQYQVKVAIISPPMIHGVGSGPVRKRSIQIPILIENTLKRGKAFQVLDGNNIWNGIHIDDLASAITVLTEEALKGDEGEIIWLPKGYYFAETEEFRWGDISSAIAEIAHAKGLIKEADVDHLSVESALEMHPWAPVLWGGNSRGTAVRLRHLGWVPAGKTIRDSLSAMIDFEVAATKKEKQDLTFA